MPAPGNPPTPNNQTEINMSQDYVPWHPNLNLDCCLSCMAVHTLFLCVQMLECSFSVCMSALNLTIQILKTHFVTQLASQQQIKPPLPKSAQIQEQHGGLRLDFKALYCAHCKTGDGRGDTMGYPGTYLT